MDYEAMWIELGFYVDELSIQDWFCCPDLLVGYDRAEDVNTTPLGCWYYFSSWLKMQKENGSKNQVEKNELQAYILVLREMANIIKTYQEANVYS